MITIPGTPYKLPSPIDLMHAGAGVTSRAWLLCHYGPDAVACWEATGCPEWAPPEPMPTDQGIQRKGWGQTRWAKRYRV